MKCRTLHLQLFFKALLPTPVARPTCLERFSYIWVVEVECCCIKYSYIFGDVIFFANAKISLISSVTSNGLVSIRLAGFHLKGEHDRQHFVKLATYFLRDFPALLTVDSFALAT